MKALALLGALLAAPLPAGAGAAAAGEAASCPPTGACLIALGDSLTAGTGLAPGKGLVPALADWLAARGQTVAIVNLGLSGDTTYGGRVRATLAARQHPRATAVMVELGANDLLLGWDAAKAEANLDAILTTLGAPDRPILLVGIAAPGRLPAARARDWAAIWPRLAQRHGARLLPDLYAPITGAPEAARPALLQRDGLHPSPAGVALLVEALGPQVQAMLAAP